MLGVVLNGMNIHLKSWFTIIFRDIPLKNKKKNADCHLKNYIRDFYIKVEKQMKNKGKYYYFQMSQLHQFKILKVKVVKNFISGFIIIWV